MNRGTKPNIGLTLINVGFSIEYRDVSLIAPPHIMQPHSAPMNPDFPELNEDSSYQDDLEIPSFFTSDFEIAKSGGRHSGFYQNYLNRPTKQINKSIKSLEVQIAKHQEKIKNPHELIPEWDRLDSRKQKYLVEVEWPGDIQRQQEHINILKGILNERSN